MASPLDETLTMTDANGNPIRVAPQGITDPALLEAIRGRSPAAAPPASPDTLLASQSLNQGPSMSMEGPTSSMPLPMPQASQASPGGLADEGFNLQKQGIMQAVGSQKKLGEQQANALGQAADLYKAEMAAAENAKVEREELYRKRELEVGELDKQIAEFKPKDFWADRSTGARMAAAIAIGMGAASQALGGGENTALKIINDSIDRDIRRQEFEFNKLKGRRDTSNSEYGRRLELLGSEDLARKSIMSTGIELAKTQLEKYAASASGEQAKANATKMLGELTSQQAMLRADIAKKMADAQISGQGKPATADQSKAAGFARRVEQAEGVFDKLTADGYDRSDISSGIGAMLPNIVRTGSAVQNDQAERNFVNALLRRESGAAISDTEFESAREQYFPRAGDSEEVLQQKKANRLQAMESLKSEAGNAYAQTPLVSSGQVTVIHPQTGKPGTIPQEKLSAALRAGYRLVE